MVSHSRAYRRVQTSYGLHFKLLLAGQAHRWSWARLVSEIVVKFGLLGVVTTVLDLLWQYLFPAVGFPDYNQLVYRNVQAEHHSTPAHRGGEDEN